MTDRISVEKITFGIYILFLKVFGSGRALFCILKNMLMLISSVKSGKKP